MPQRPQQLLAVELAFVANACRARTCAGPRLHGAPCGHGPRARSDCFTLAAQSYDREGVVRQPCARRRQFLDPSCLAAGPMVGTTAGHPQSAPNARAQRTVRGLQSGARRRVCRRTVAQQVSSGPLASSGRPAQAAPLCPSEAYIRAELRDRRCLCKCAQQYADHCNACSPRASLPATATGSPHRGAAAAVRLRCPRDTVTSGPGAADPAHHSGSAACVVLPWREHMQIAYALEVSSAPSKASFSTSWRWLAPPLACRSPALLATSVRSSLAECRPGLCA